MTPLGASFARHSVTAIRESFQFSPRLTAVVTLSISYNLFIRLVVINNPLRYDNFSERLYKEISLALKVECVYKVALASLLLLGANSKLSMVNVTTLLIYMPLAFEGALAGFSSVHFYLARFELNSLERVSIVFFKGILGIYGASVGFREGPKAPN